MNRKSLLLSFLLLFITFSLFAADGPPNTGEENARKSDLAGGVFHVESKRPLENVSVTAYSANKKEKVVVTDANGNFSFNDLKPGTYRFVFEKSGFKKVTKEKNIVREDEAFQLNVHMEEHNSFDFMPGPSHFFDF